MLLNMVRAFVSFARTVGEILIGASLIIYKNSILPKTPTDMINLVAFILGAQIVYFLLFYV